MLFFGSIRFCKVKFIYTSGITLNVSRRNAVTVNIA